MKTLFFPSLSHSLYNKAFIQHPDSIRLIICRLIGPRVECVQHTNTKEKEKSKVTQWRHINLLPTATTVCRHTHTDTNTYTDECYCFIVVSGFLRSLISILGFSYKGSVVFSVLFILFFVLLFKRKTGQYISGYLSFYFRPTLLKFGFVIFNTRTRTRRSQEAW